MESHRLASQNSRRMFARLMNLMWIVMVLFATSSCKSQASFAPRILKEGDSLNGMVLTTGVSHAPPLEAFCRFEEEEDVTTIDCQVPSLEKLAIGHIVGATGQALQVLDWSQLDWQVSLDGYQLDLDTFHEQTYLMPDIPAHPSEIREIFRQQKAWDIVLVNPTLGLHTLDCTVKANSVVHNWVVKFMVNSSAD